MSFFGETELDIFNAQVGAWSEVTSREAGNDKSVTLDKNEKGVLYGFYDQCSFTRAGGGAADGIPAEKVFNVIQLDTGMYAPRELAIKYPKRTGQELRLYFNRSSGFYPAAGERWFVFSRNGIDLPFIGAITADVYDIISSKKKSYEFDYSFDEEDQDYQKGVVSLKAQEGVAVYQVTSQKRDANLASRYVRDSGYKCQFDETHETFVSATTGQPYIEVHHIIPIAKTPDFAHSLDVVPNLIALCPNCHRAIHFGSPEVKSTFLEYFYKTRSELLVEAGIEITEVSLFSYYGINRA